MSAAIRAAHFTKCRCGDWIKPGDAIVFYEDAATHIECEPSHGWGLPDTATVVRQLQDLLNRRGNITQAMFDADFDPSELPARIEEAVWEAMAAESKLWSLCEDVVSEHREVEHG